jgi:transcriptional regulator with XRE-family HTH domain
MTLKDLRKEKKFTLGQLAKTAGISQKTISDYENNPPVRPRNKVLSKIAEALGIDQAKLLSLIYPGKNKKKVQEIPEEEIILQDSELNRILRLLDKEIEELRYLLVECGNVGEEHTSVKKIMGSVNQDLELLYQIKGSLQ